MSPAARWGGLLVWFLAPGAWALGLGDIELDSALNQPLRAEILLVSATDEELSSLRITLADAATFDRYGLDRPTFLSGINFALARDAQGRPVVAVTSARPIAEPFVTLLIEANWSRGRILREYTVLLDPPVLMPAAVAAPAVQPAQAGASPAPQAAAPIDRPPPAALTPLPTPSVAPAPTAPASAPAAVAAQPAPQPAPQATPQATAATPATYGPVQPAETLWSIANRYRPEGVTINQMMVAVFRANPGAFSGNMNTLHQGATLRIPQPAEFASVSAADATQEALRQTALWRGDAEAQARLRLVAPEETSAAAGGGGADSAAATSPAATQAAGSASAPSSSAAEVADLEGELQALRAELDDSQRLLQIRDQQLQELQQQLRALEEARQAAVAPPAAEPAGAAAAAVPSAGVDLEAEPLFADEPAPEAAETAEDPAPAVTVPPAVTQVVAPSPEPSLISRALTLLLSPILLIGLGLLALVGTAAWYLRYRQQDVEDVTGRWEALEAELDEEDAETREATERMRQQESDAAAFVVEETLSEDEPQLDDGAGTATANDLEELESSLFAAPVAGAEEDSGETLTIGVPPSEPETDDTISSQTVINLEQADPIAEADFHMAYGLYDQAAELVEKALEADPGRRDLTLKLLEVFFVWGNRDAFLQTAQALHAEIGGAQDSDWDKVVIMGKQICPDDALFSATTASSAGSVDVDLEAGESPALDMSFDGEESAGVDLGLGDFGEDIDLELEPGDSQEQPGGDALDLGDQTAAGLEAALVVADEEGREGDAGPEAAAVSSDLAADDDSLDSTAETETDLDEDALAGEMRASDRIDEPGLDFDLTGETDTDAVDRSLDRTVEQTGELPVVESAAASEDGRDPEDRTAEIDLDDLGLDVEDLADLTSDLNALATPEELDSGATTASDDEILSSPEIADVLSDDDVDAAAAEDAAARAVADAGDSSVLMIGDRDETLLAAGNADDETLLAIGDRDATMLASDPGESRAGPVLGDDEATMLAPGYGSGDDVGSTKRMEQSSEDDLDLDGVLEDVTADIESDLADATASIDLNLADLESALEESDTVEQPIAQSVGSDVTPGDSARADTGASSRSGMLDPHTMTMTEVGTKLDLARAYMDMGDPDGAKSILEEVLEEGDENQRQEAQGLIESL